MAEILHDQAAPLGGAVEVLINIDGGAMPSGAKRQSLLQQARGNYVACVDDDDELHANYAKLLLDGCATGADVVTFNLEFVRRGGTSPPATIAPASRPHRQSPFRNVRQSRPAAVAPRNEVWRFGLAPDARSAGRMAANHLCAWRRALAQRVAWCPVLGYADDQLWYKPLLASGLVKTEHHIDENLYRYLFDQATTCNQKTERIQFSRNYVGAGLGCYWRDAEIMIEVGNGANSPNAKTVLVRDRHNHEALIPRDKLRLFHTVHIA